MADVIVDPSEMREFERSLRELRNEIDARRAQLEQQVHDIRAFWNDEKYKNFVRRKEELMLEIQIFTKMCDRYSDYLRRKAAAVDAYLGR